MQQCIYLPLDLDPEKQKEAFTKAEAEFEDLCIKEVREVSNYLKTARAKTDAYVGLFKGVNRRES